MADESSSSRARAKGSRGRGRTNAENPLQSTNFSGRGGPHRGRGGNQAKASVGRGSTNSVQTVGSRGRGRTNAENPHQSRNSGLDLPLSSPNFGDGASFSGRGGGARGGRGGSPKSKPVVGHNPAYRTPGTGDKQKIQQKCNKIEVMMTNKKIPGKGNENQGIGDKQKIQEKCNKIEVMMHKKNSGKEKENQGTDEKQKIQKNKNKTEVTMANKKISGPEKENQCTAEKQKIQKMEKKIKAMMTNKKFSGKEKENHGTNEKQKIQKMEKKIKAMMKNKKFQGKEKENHVIFEKENHGINEKQKIQKMEKKIKAMTKNKQIPGKEKENHVIFEKENHGIDEKQNIQKMEKKIMAMMKNRKFPRKEKENHGIAEQQKVPKKGKKIEAAMISKKGKENQGGNDIQKIKKRKKKIVVMLTNKKISGKEIENQVIFPFDHLGTDGMQKIQKKKQKIEVMMTNKKCSGKEKENQGTDYKQKIQKRTQKIAVVGKNKKISGIEKEKQGTDDKQKNQKQKKKIKFFQLMMRNKKNSQKKKENQGHLVSEIKSRNISQSQGPPQPEISGIEPITHPDKIGNSAVRMIKLLIKQLETHHAFSNDKEFYNFIKKLKLCTSLRTLNTILVPWSAPPTGWLKLNTDGTFKLNPSRSGCGGLIRDSAAGFVAGFCKQLYPVDNNVAEVLGVLHGLEFVSNHFPPVPIWIESDSLIVVNAISGQCSIPEEWRSDISRIKCLLADREWKISHIFREGNRCADWFADKGVSSSCSFHSLPQEICHFLDEDAKSAFVKL
ncbi:uncharacterized protein LOC143884688 isoform X4 [Tasmannia lanceolata]|uniref:uncharacterized protein LOC143884688 isoform X4 n=1 Tax=Tasmannia lanceolata TaxID=3420 RepID=UPI0040632A10